MGNRFNKQDVLSDALMYKSRKEWQKGSPSKYNASLRNGWHQEACAHMEWVSHRGKWTLQEVIDAASRHSNPSEWERNDPKSYYIAKKRKEWYQKATLHMTSLHRKWTLNDVLSEARRFNSLIEWQRKSRNSYSVAYRNGWVMIASSHMAKPATPKVEWTRDLIILEASKYKTLTDWQNQSRKSYEVAIRLNIKDEASAHMKKSSKISMPELELRTAVSAAYNNIQFNKIIKNKTPIHNIIHGFELDIYIPELRKGIEFNGNYWHSFEGLKRSRAHLGWSDDLIKNYHNIKRDFFRSHNIDYIEIWENEWKQDKQKCINKVLMFLQNRT